MNKKKFYLVAVTQLFKYNKFMFFKLNLKLKKKILIK
jgi:hypothetical protein